MKPRLVIILLWAASVGLLALPGGCTADASSTDAILQNLLTFFTDFARQIMTALLL